MLARWCQAQRLCRSWVLSATSDGYVPVLAGSAQASKLAHRRRERRDQARWANNRNDRLPALVADLIGRNVSVLAANGPSAFLAKAATSTVPIVFFAGYNPVTVGLVASLNRPGGNITGVSILNVELGPKRLEMARELVPTATDMALLVNQTNPNAKPLARSMQAAAATLGLKLHVFEASNQAEVDRVFEAASTLRVGALVIGPDPFFNTRTAQLAALTLRHCLPAIYQYRAFTAAGGLASYGGDIIDLYPPRRHHRPHPQGARAGRPADQQATKVGCSSI
jgi:putative ABC transport system substrate-binding protein